MKKIISLLLINSILITALPLPSLAQSRKSNNTLIYLNKEDIKKQARQSSVAVSESTRQAGAERLITLKNEEFAGAIAKFKNLKNINVTPGQLELNETGEAYRYFSLVGKSARSGSAAHGKIISEYYHILRDYEYLKADATGREVWTAPGRGHKDMYITVKNADGSVKMAVTFNALNKGFLKAFAKSFEKVTDRETALHYSEQVYKIMLKTDGVDYDTNHVLAAYFKKGLELKWVCDEVSGMEIREDWAIARNKKDRLCPNAVTSMLALGYLGQGEQNVYEFLNHNYMGRNAHAVLKGGANALMLMDSEASYEALKKVIKNSVKKATPTNVFKIALNAFFDLIWVTSYVERGYKYFKGVYNNEVTIRFEYPDVKHIKKFGLPSTAGKCTPFSSTRDCVMMPTRNVWEDIGSELILFGGARGKKLVSELVSEEPNLHKPFTIGAAIYSDYNQKLYYAYKAGSAYADMPEGTRRRIELELGRGSAINENHIGMVTEYRKAMSGARGFDQIMGGVYMVALVVSLPSFMEFVASIPQWARGSRIGRYFSASRGAQAGKAAPSEAIGSNLKPQVEVNKQIGLDLIKEYNEAFGLKTPRNPGTTPGTNIYTPPNTKVPVFNSGRPGGARPQVGGGNVDVLTKPRPQPQTSGPILNTLTNEVKTLYKPRPQVSEVEVITQPQVQPITNILETLTQNYVKAEEALSTLNKGKGANVISDITGTPAQLPAQTPNITKGFSYITTLAGTLFNNKTEVITQPQTKTVKTEAIPQPAQVNMLERIITNTTDSAAHPSAIMQNPGEETPKMPETERVDHGRLERELNNAKNGYISQYLMNNFFSLTQEQQKELDKILTETAKRPKTDLHQINPLIETAYNGEPYTFETVEKNIMDATFYVKSNVDGKFLGSGTFIEREENGKKKIYGITAFHFTPFELGEKMTISLYNGGHRKVVHGTFVAMGNDYGKFEDTADIALIDFNQNDLAGVFPLKVASKTIREGDVSVSYGYEMKNFAKSNPRQTLKVTPLKITTSWPYTQNPNGACGSPLLDSRGYVVGMQNGKEHDNSAAYAANAQYINRLFDIYHNEGGVEKLPLIYEGIKIGQMASNRRPEHAVITNPAGGTFSFTFSGFGLVNTSKLEDYFDLEEGDVLTLTLNGLMDPETGAEPKRETITYKHKESAPYNLETVEENILNATFSIHAPISGGMLGTGTLVEFEHNGEKKILGLSAYHLMKLDQDGMLTTAIYNNGEYKKIKSKVLAYGHGGINGPDFMVIEIPQSALTNAYPLKIADNVDLGDFLTSYGFAGFKFGKIPYRIVTGIDQLKIRTTSNFNMHNASGVCGSPLVNNEGKLVAIHMKGKSDFSPSYAVNINLLADFMQAYYNGGKMEYPLIINGQKIGAINPVETGNGTGEKLNAVTISAPGQDPIVKEWNDYAENIDYAHLENSIKLLPGQTLKFTITSGNGQVRFITHTIPAEQKTEKEVKSGALANATVNVRSDNSGDLLYNAYTFTSEINGSIETLGITKSNAGKISFRLYSPKEQQIINFSVPLMDMGNGLALFKVPQNISEKIKPLKLSNTKESFTPEGANHPFAALLDAEGKLSAVSFSGITVPITEEYVEDFINNNGYRLKKQLTYFNRPIAQFAEEDILTAVEIWKDGGKIKEIPQNPNGTQHIKLDKIHFPAIGEEIVFKIKSPAGDTYEIIYNPFKNMR
ncbi:hypothetical protein AAIR98_000975 [Elusimicrobium simillimum]|uniref:hypothetical protein n=1 Tax=Elusimicrobium simillimum TaxID=3143438 RepID=UPI003C704435